MNSCRNDQRRQIGLGEIAVIVRLLLRAHGVGAALVRVPQPRLLHNAPARFDHFDLALDLVLQRRADEFEAVDVLHFGLGAEFFLPSWADADIRVAAQRTLLHVAVGDAGVEQDLLQSRQVLEGLVGRADVGLADDLDQRRAAAVQVEIGVRGGVGKPLVQALARIFFHVHARDADLLRSAVGRWHLDPAVLGQRLIELRNLVALGQIGIEVVLAREDGALAHLAVERQRGQRGELDGLGVQHRQRARQPQANRADVGIRLGAEPVGATAKRLGRREQLHVHFEPDHRLVFGQNIGRDSCGGHDWILARARWAGSLSDASGFLGARLPTIASCIRPQRLEAGQFSICFRMEKLW